MKRMLSVLAIAFVVVAGAPVVGRAQSAALPTVDQVLDKWIAALGGRAAIEKHTSRVSKGAIESPGAPISGTIEVSEKAPNKALSAIKLEVPGQVIASREGFDGTTAWEDDGKSGPQDKSAKEAADARRDATFNSELKMKEMFKSLTVSAQETIGGRPAYLVLGTTPEGTTTRFWFAADTGLLIRTRSTRESPSGPVDIDVFLEDYREVDGVKTPFVIRQVTPQFTMIFRLNDIKFNVPLDDAIFKKPAKAPAATVTAGR